MIFLRFYFDFMASLFSFLTLDFFVYSNEKSINPSNTRRVRILYIVYIILFSIPNTLPFSELIALSMDFLYIFLSKNHNIKITFLRFLKYEMYVIISTIIIFIFHSFVTNDFQYVNTNELYYNYKSLICACITYVILCLYIYGKRLAALKNKKRHGILFCIAIALSIFILSFLSLATIVGQFSEKEALPVIFSLIFIMVAIFLSAYGYTICSFEENAKQEILLSKYELETAYYQNVKDSMDTLRSLRHDFKNHMIILNRYANSHELDKLQTYIQKISDTITDVSIIQTPHDLTSSILNAKALLCKQTDIKFTCNCSFSEIHISDFQLMTILGNMLDNAITAAGKTTNGWISLSMEQQENFLRIYCKNNHSEKILEKNGSFISTKDNTNPFHGIGIKNIKDTIESLNGSIEIKHDENLFSMLILLPNYL